MNCSNGVPSLSYICNLAISTGLHAPKIRVPRAQENDELKVTSMLRPHVDNLEVHVRYERVVSIRWEVRQGELDNGINVVLFCQGKRVASPVMAPSEVPK